jgi:hypothetical protein
MCTRRHIPPAPTPPPPPPAPTRRSGCCYVGNITCTVQLCRKERHTPHCVVFGRPHPFLPPTPAPYCMVNIQNGAPRDTPTAADTPVSHPVTPVDGSPGDMPAATSCCWFVMGAARWAGGQQQCGTGSSCREVQLRHIDGPRHMLLLLPLLLLCMLSLHAVTPSTRLDPAIHTTCTPAGSLLVPPMQSRKRHACCSRPCALQHPACCRCCSMLPKPTCISCCCCCSCGLLSSRGYLRPVPTAAAAAAGGPVFDPKHSSSTSTSTST